MRPRILLGTLLLLAIPVVISAQGTLVVSYNKCALTKQGEIRRMVDTTVIPIAQEMVNEGKLIAAGSDYHAWGDEWNVVYWYSAKDVPSFLTAFSELTKRVSERYPTLLPQIISWCTEHKDSFYSVGGTTTPAPAAAPAKKN